MATGSQYGLSAYVLPSAQCELQLTSAQVGFINVMFMIGMCMHSNKNLFSKSIRKNQGQNR